jgi:hypothetical protein
MGIGSDRRAFWVLFMSLWALYAAIPQRGPEVSLIGAELENIVERGRLHFVQGEMIGPDRSTLDPGASGHHGLCRSTGVHPASPFGGFGNRLRLPRLGRGVVRSTGCHGAPVGEHEPAGSVSSYHCSILCSTFWL